jgi:hypothetical protein
MKLNINMKTNNIVPLKKIALLAAAVCAAMLAVSPNATALTIGDNQELGKVFFGVPSGDDNRLTYVNAMIGLDLNGSTFVDYSPPAFQNNLVTRSNNDFGPLPTATLLVPSANGTGTSVDLGDGTLYSYLFAKYDGKNAGSEVWYVGDLSGTITIPGFGLLSGENYALSGWTLFGPGGTSVPDGGTTVMLLGAALGSLGMARRFLKK